MRYTHVLFDFFGTLVDYSPSHIDQGFAATHALLTDAGLPLAYDQFLARWDTHFEAFDQRASVDHAEYSMDALCSAFLDEHLATVVPPTLIARFRDAYLSEWSRGVRAIPGLGQLLSDLAERYTLALVTNTHHADMVRGHLRRLQIDTHFRTVITSVEHGRRKPSACIFDRALQACDASAESALYVGDSYAADYLGASAAKLDCLLIDPGHHHEIPVAHRLTSILDLRSHLLPM